MTGDAPLIEITGVTKRYGVGEPLRLTRLQVARGDRWTLSGFDAGAAETFVHLVTGAALPDEGDVRVAGGSTRDIATDTEWLASLDRFGIVTARAILLDGQSVAANLALPLTLSIDPIPDDVRDRIDALAADVGLAPDRLAAPASAVTAAERVRLHLARALAVDPLILLLEHPAVALDPADQAALGRTLRQVADARGLGWIAFSDDEPFARAAGGTRVRLRPEDGELVGQSFWRRLVSR
jgi:ABC-type transporter Mla maintaining outer membrane lipid asymmetry ATPase subunit MlaF